MKKISVIIPIYNAEKTLKRCIDSVLQQDYENLQIILIDDGSTDKSPDICDFYAKTDKRIEIVHQKNAGVCTVRNTGLELATGDYITFLDSDDYIKENAYNKMFESLESNSAEVCLCRFLNGNLEDTISTEPHAPRIPAGIYDSYDIENYLFAGNWYLNGLVCALWNKLYSRKVLSGFKFSGAWGEDYELNDYVFSKHVKVAVIEDGLVAWCYNPQSQTHQNYSSKRISYLSVLVKQIDLFADSKNIVYEAKKLFCEQYIEYYIISMINGYESPKEYRDFFMKFSNDLSKDEKQTLKWKLRMCIFRLSPKLYYFLTKKNWSSFKVDEQ
ncbi:MAG: glycosyltransferase family 2 protein [Erysipelotrichaceae bacterium]|nr:glycosyltransferase family 2 protein [Erysipelotrichaceae bacterium]